MIPNSVMMGLGEGVLSVCTVGDCSETVEDCKGLWKTAVEQWETVGDCGGCGGLWVIAGGTMDDTQQRVVGIGGSFCVDCKRLQWNNGRLWGTVGNGWRHNG